MAQQDSEDTAWEKADGVPSLHDQFIQKYLQGRDNLVAQEKKQRSDRSFRENLSPAAAEACSIVDQIRFEEQQTLWTKDFEDSLAKQERGDIYPGMMFVLAKERMERSRLWKIIRRMPKGALLHCHLDAMVDLDWMINELLDTDCAYITAQQSLSSPDALEMGTFAIRYTWKNTSEETNIWSDTYNPDTLCPVAKTADAFPTGGRDGFRTWLRSRCSITHEEALSQHHGPNDIWRKFYRCFGVLGTILHYEPITRKFIARMLKQLMEDGVQWVDIRTVLSIPFQLAGKEVDKEDLHVKEQLAVLVEEIEKFQATDAGKEFWGARLIWTTIRAWDKRTVVDDMKRCIDMKVEFPDLICGYDLVGQEDLGRPLADLTPELFWFKKRCAEESVDIPFFFHAGETLGDGDSTDENLFDSVLLGTRRIGHAFSLYKHPMLIDMVKEKKILVESCPVSNEVLRLTGSIMSHPLPALLARGVPCSLSNDDPGILGQGSAGMTHDFWQALQGWENLGLAGLGSLAENSVRWASFEDLTTKEFVQDVKDGVFGEGERADRLKEWIKAWERFCQWIVDEYGADENENPDE